MKTLPSLVTGATALLAAGAAALDHGLVRWLSRRFDRSIYGGPTDRPTVALTFDDGPGPQSRELLRFLAREAIPATFFQSGINVERYPDISQQMHAAGHELGNHAYSHPRLSPRLHPSLHIPSFKLMHRELLKTQQLLTQITGTPPRLFRPPYGQRWIGLDLVQRRLGLLGVQWTVIGHDWEWIAERIAARVLERSGPGAIICLHDGRDTQPSADIRETLAALRLIVPALRARGLGFQTVTDLLARQPLPQPAMAV